MGGEQTATPLSLTPWDTLFTETDVNYFMLRQSFAPSQKFGYEFGIWNISCSTQKCFPLFRPLGMPCFLPRLKLVLLNVVHWAPVQRLVRENSQELLLQGGKETGLSRERLGIEVLFYIIHWSSGWNWSTLHRKPSLKPQVKALIPVHYSGLRSRLPSNSSRNLGQDAFLSMGNWWVGPELWVVSSQHPAQWA